MAITKSQILTFVNKALERDETDIDLELNRVLFDISTAGNFLADIDTSNTIDDSDSIIDYPTNWKALDNIRLLDGNGRFTDYLDEISYNEYLSSQFLNMKSQPTAFAVWNEQILFTPIAPEEYTVYLSYFKIHPATPDSIQFDDRFLSVLQSGVTFEVASSYGLTDQISLWSARYNADMRKIKNYQLKPIYKTNFSRF